MVYGQDFGRPEGGANRGIQTCQESEGMRRCPPACWKGSRRASGAPAPHPKLLSLASFIHPFTHPTNK